MSRDVRARFAPIDVGPMNPTEMGGARVAVHDAPLTSVRRQILCQRFDAIDAMDIERFLAVHTDDGDLIFGSRPPVRGKAEMSEQIQEFWRTIAGVRHDVARVGVSGATVFVESVVTYERLDGSSVGVPCCDVFEFEGDRIRETRAYLDQSQVARGSLSSR